MKRILIYGDSNTWGQKAYGGRYDHDEQWPNILANELGSDINIIQEGLPGRIAGEHIKDNNKYKNGKTSYETILRTSLPVDIIIIALGTNDVKTKYNLNTDQIINDLEFYRNFSDELLKSKPYKLVSNPIFIYLGISNFKNTDYFEANYSTRDEVNLYLKDKYHFIKVDNLEHSNDGIHYSKNDHLTVAKLVESKIRELI